MPCTQQIMFDTMVVGHRLPVHICLTFYFHLSLCVNFLNREATVTALPPGGTISLGVSRAPSPEDDKEALLGRSTLGDGEKTWGFSTTDGGTAGTVRRFFALVVSNVRVMPVYV